MLIFLLECHLGKEKKVEGPKPSLVIHLMVPVIGEEETPSMTTCCVIIVINIFIQ